MASRSARAQRCRPGAHATLVLGLVASLACTNCLDDIPDDTLTPKDRGVLHGRILDKCSGAGLGGASVSAGGRQVLAGADGSYELADLAPGQQNVSVSLTGYLSSQPQVTVPEGSKLLLDIKLAPNSFNGLAKKLDVLFVIDNSGSMGEEQQALANAFDGFITTLGAVFADVHVGVVSTDVGAGSFNLPSCERAGGDAGKLQNASRQSGCVAPSDPWIAINDGTASNTAGTSAAEAFACISRLGTAGCGFEQPLEAMRRALTPAANPGFVRDDAFLAVVVVSDEDDCSASDGSLFDPSQGATGPLGPLTSFRCFEFGVTCDEPAQLLGPKANCKPATNGKYTEPVATYIDFIRGLKPEGAVFFGVIAGPTSRVEVGRDGNNPVLKASCTSAGGVAVPAIRLEAVAEALNVNITPKPIYSICDSKLPLSAAAHQLLSAAAGQTCK